MGRVLGADGVDCLHGGVLARGGGEGSLGLFLADVAINFGGTALCGGAFPGVFGRGDGAADSSGRALGWGESSRLRLVLTEGLALDCVEVVADAADARTGTGVPAGKNFFSVQTKAPWLPPQARPRARRTAHM